MQLNQILGFKFRNKKDNFFMDKTKAWEKDSLNKNRQWTRIQQR